MCTSCAKLSTRVNKRRLQEHSTSIISYRCPLSYPLTLFAYGWKSSGTFADQEKATISKIKPLPQSHFLVRGKPGFLIVRVTAPTSYLNFRWTLMESRASTSLLYCGLRSSHDFLRTQETLPSGIRGPISSPSRIKLLFDNDQDD